MTTMQTGAYDAGFSLDDMLDLQKVPYRKSPMEPDQLDGHRASVPKKLWHSQDAALRARDRQVEENVRMLAGQQWSVFNPMLGRWIDVTQFMTDDEKRWRQRPVFNRILSWYMLTHARATENPPIVTFIPGPDRIDADLAETLDTIGKIVWREADVSDVWDRVASWLIVAGSGYAQSRVDIESGPIQEWRGMAEIPEQAVDAMGQVVVDPNTGQPVIVGTVPAEGVPFDQQGNPLAVMQNGNMIELGPPHRTRQPKIVVDVMSPLEVRGEWGPTPWHMKRWHLSRHFLTTGQVLTRYGVKVTPDANLSAGLSDTGELGRLNFGGGYYGPTASGGLSGDSTQAMATEGLVDVYCLWLRPKNAMDQGRLLVTTGAGEVLYDGPRPVDYPNTSPIRRWDFVRIPGRGSGTTPQDTLNGPQRAYNKRWAQLMEHAALVSNPKPVIDSMSGLRANQWTNEPGVAVMVNKRANVHAIEWIAPPPISGDVWHLLAELRSEMQDLGNLRGTEGAPPTDDASGELVKELRFNSDRFLGPTLRRSPDEFARMFEDWRVLMPAVYPFETLVSYAGEDNAARTITVRPDLFTAGKVNVVADTESMLPEGRGERQQRVYAMWKDGAFGMPNSPQALKQLYELMRFPHISRTAKPGGVDRTMAEQENARLLMQEPAQSIPVYEWQDHIVHLEVLEGFMKSPEYEKQLPHVQEAFQMHRAIHLQWVTAMMPAPMPGGGDPMGDPNAGQPPMPGGM